MAQYQSGACGNTLKIVEFDGTGGYAAFGIGFSNTTSPTDKKAKLEVYSDPTVTLTHEISKFLQDNNNYAQVWKGYGTAQAQLVKHVVGQIDSGRILTGSASLGATPSATAQAAYAPLLEVIVPLATAQETYTYIYYVKCMLKTGEIVFGKFLANIQI